MATDSSILSVGNPTDRGAWWATDHGVTKSHMTEQTRAHLRVCARAHTHTHTHTHSVLSRWRPEALPNVVLHTNRCAERCFHDGFGVMTGD